jgi:hypothetical protein
LFFLSRILLIISSNPFPPLGFLPGCSIGSLLCYDSSLDEILFISVIDNTFGDFSFVECNAELEKFIPPKFPSNSWPKTDARAESGERLSEVETENAANVDASILFFCEFVSAPNKFGLIEGNWLALLYSCGASNCTAKSAAVLLYDEGPANLLTPIKFEAPLIGLVRCQSSSSSKQISGGGALISRLW